MRDERKARAIEALGDIARRVDRDQEKRYVAAPSGGERGQPVRNLFEVDPKQSGQCVDVVGPRLGRAGKAIERHADRACGIAGQRATRQCERAGLRERLAAQDRSNRFAQRGVRDVQRNLPTSRESRERIVEQQLVVVAIIAADRAQHYLGRNKAHAGALLAEPGDAASSAGDFGGQRLCARFDRGEVVAAFGQKAPRLADRIAFAGSVGIFALRRQRLLFARISGVEPQHRLGYSREAGGQIGNFERGQIDIGEQWVLEYVAQPPRIVFGIFTRELGDVDLVIACQSQQQIGGHRTLIAFEQRDVAG